MILKTPRFFSPGADQKLLPEALGAERYAKILRSVTAGKFTCELTMFEMSDPGRLATELNSDAPYLLEWRADSPPEGSRVSRKSVRVVDCLAFWARHVDIAIKQNLGALIFAPWFTQAEINGLFRTAMIARHEGEVSSASQEYAANVLRMLVDLSGEELMLAAMGIEYQVSKWSAEDWLDGMHNLPAKPRKQYAQQFARHVRFLPSTRKFQSLAPIWHKNANGSEAPIWQFKAIADFDRHLKHLRP